MKLLSFGEIIWDVFGEDHALGGAPLNFAAHAALQGCKTWLASAVGDDAPGAEALRKIVALGLGTEFVSVHGGAATGQCLVTLDESGVPSYNILTGVAYERIDLPDEPAQAFDVMAFGTLALHSEHNRQAIVRFLSRNACAEVYTDLNIRPPFYSAESIEFCLSYATIVKISDEELPTVTNTLWSKTLAPREAVEVIASRYPQIKLLLITCGAEGSLCYDCRSGRFYECAAEPADVVSTVGAGDSFGATFLVWYVKTKDIALALKQASRVSAFVVSRQGAVPADTAAFLRTLSADGAGE